MTTLIASVFLASLLGSTHCAGMCGAFVAFAVGTGEGGAGPSKARLLVAYNGGRLLTYCTLGAAFGALGGALDMAGSMAGVSRVAAMLAGATLIVFGGAQLLRALGARVPHARPPATLARTLKRANGLAMTLPPVRRALVIGLMTTLLPCGWLYAFVAAAAGTGSAALGAVTMAAFWLGTLPVLAAVGVGVRALSGPLAAKLPVVMPALIVGAGLVTIWTRAGVSAESLSAVGARVEAVDVDTLTEKVSELTPEGMPCCDGGGPSQ